jgi:deoxyribodipyrimidine photo-lyase
MKSGVDERVRQLNSQPVRSGARYVLYWMRANRRAAFNHALAFAAILANDRDLPLLCCETLSSDDPYASDRLHSFVLEGVPENARRLRELGAGYVFWLRRGRSDPGDVIERLAADAAAVVTDDHPTLPEPPSFPAAAWAVDSSCIVPMSQIPGKQYAAYTIRPKIRNLLPQFLEPLPPVRLDRRCPDARREFHTEVSERGVPALVASCEIDHTVPPAISFRGGTEAAEERLQDFLEHKLPRYERDRNDPAARATSELSPYLHFGHISSLEVALRTGAHAKRHKLSADGFLDELIVRRELAFNFARYAAHRDSLSELPDWARQTLAEHAADPRPVTCSRDDFIAARTPDALWNAAQKEMLRRGYMHNYCRMYWGKKILEWSRTYEAAVKTAIYIHDRFSLDGRDPNTYANILWCFGLHDRPWPERPVFGRVRAMTRAGMDRKINVEAYIRQVESL